MAAHWTFPAAGGGLRGLAASWFAGGMIEDGAQGEVLGRIGPLEARLAASPRELRAAQRLRYRVFFEEMQARPSASARLLRRDADAYDEVCEHILIFDTAGAADGGVAPRRPRLVATTRLLPQERAARAGGFYSQGEFEIGALIARHPSSRILELGRSCVLASHRDRRTVELLWRAIWTYVRGREVDLMFGCASLPGTDPTQHAMALSYLYHHHLAPPEVRVRAVDSRYINMNMLEPGSYDPRKAMARVPPLIKGYLRLGGFVGDGAVIDHEFNSTDVFIIVKTELVTEKYIRHYERGMRDQHN